MAGTRRRHGYLCFRLYFNGLESHEGTALKDTQENRLKIERRAQIITDEMEEGTFDYLRWFPDGNLATRFRGREGTGRPEPVPIITVRGFFERWGSAPLETEEEAQSVEKQTRPVSPRRRNPEPTRNL